MPNIATHAVIALACAVATPQAAKAFDLYAPADPAAALRDFNETCAKGFPDLDMVERTARASGWIQSEIQGPADLVSEHPVKIFHRDGTLLFLSHPSGGPFKTLCQLSGHGQTKLTAADLAVLATPALGAGSPTFAKSRQKDAAIYTTGPGLSIEASVDAYRKSRTISLTAQQAR